MNKYLALFCVVAHGPVSNNELGLHLIEMTSISVSIAQERSLERSILASERAKADAKEAMRVWYNVNRLECGFAAIRLLRAFFCLPDAPETESIYGQGSSAMYNAVMARREAKKANASISTGEASVAEDSAIEAALAKRRTIRAASIAQAGIKVEIRRIANEVRRVNAIIMLIASTRRMNI